MKDHEKHIDLALRSGFPFENDTLLLINKHFPTSKISRNLEYNTVNEDNRPATWVIGIFPSKIQVVTFFRLLIPDLFQLDQQREPGSV